MKRFKPLSKVSVSSSASTFYHRLSTFQLLASVGVFAIIGTIILTVSHAATNTVQFGVFCSTDSCNNNNLSNVTAWSGEIQSWYQQQVGKTFTVPAVQTIYGHHNTAWYQNDPAANFPGVALYINCPANSSFNSICFPYANIAQEYASQHPGEITDVVLGWSTGASSSYCGLGGPLIGNQNEFSTNMGMPYSWGLGVVDPSALYGNCGSGDKTAVDLAHELGHGFGMNHVQSGTLMNPSGCPSGVLQSCSLELVTPNQPPYLASNSWFNTTSGQPTSPCSGNCPAPPSAGTSAPANLSDVISTPAHNGTWGVSGTGQVYPHGSAVFYGDLSSKGVSNIVGMASTVDGGGYWLVGSDGSVYSFGNAPFYGSMGGKTLAKPVVGMAADPQGGGYWLVASDGGIFTFGSSKFYGSTGAITLAAPIVGMAPTPTGKGYWLVASDGGIFSYGNATFYGSTGNIKLNQPIVGLAPTPDSKGYWLVASDGGIFSFGDAKFFGSLVPQNVQVAGMSATGTGSGQGYIILTTNNTAYTFPGAVVEALGFPVSANTNTTNDNLTINIVGYPSSATSVTLTSQNHTLGNCPNNTVIPSPVPVGLSNGQGTITCSGTTFGYTGVVKSSGTEIVAPIPAGYTVGWTVLSGSVGDTTSTAAGNCTNSATNAICVNMPANASSATIQATYTSTAAATLNVGVSGGPTSVPMKAQPSPDGITHQAGYCGTSFNAPTSCTSASGGIIGVSATDPEVIQAGTVAGYVFSSWTGCQSVSGANCSIYVANGQTASITANYVPAAPSILNVAVSGYTGSVTFKTYQHSVADCDTTIPGQFAVSATNNYGSRTCTSTAGYGIGSPDGLYIAPVVPSGYAFAGWTVSGATTGCTNTSNTTLTSLTQCVNIAPNGNSATITATFTVNQPASLIINTTGVAYSALKFSSSPHDIGYCYGYTQAWQWPGGGNTCSSGTDPSGNYYPIGPTTLTAPATYTDTSNRQWNFTGWSGYCSGTGGCYVNLPQGQGASVTANYQLASSTTLYIYVSGASGPVSMSSTNHTLGSCNQSYQAITVYGGSYASCTSNAGYGMGWSDGANLNTPSSVYYNGATYNFSSWSGNSWSGAACTYAAASRCINMAPGSGTATVTANYTYIPPAPTCPVSGSYAEELCIGISGGAYANSYAYTTNHSLGTCVSSTGTWFYIPANCNGFQFGPPDGLTIYANNPNGVSNFSYWSIDQYPNNGSISCYSTWCNINYGGNGYNTAIITAHYY